MSEPDSVLATTDVATETDTSPEGSGSGFPVRTQLLLLGTLLILLFAAAGGSVTQFASSMRAPLPGTENSTASPASAVIEDDGASSLTIPANIAIEGDAAFVWDVKTGTVLYEKQSEKILPLASLTKLMTALIAYEMIEGTTSVTIPGSAEAQESASGLRGGDKLTATTLTSLALVASSNDAAYSLASTIGSLLGEANAVEQFVAAMNIRARELNLSSLAFKNTTGLDLTATEAGAMGSAHDVTRLMEYLLIEHPDLLANTTAENLRAYNSTGDFYDVENTNALIGQIPNLLGSKTGYTELAGGNLTVAFDAGFNRPIIVTVLSSSRNGRFNDVITLIDAITVGTTN